MAMTCTAKYDSGASSSQNVEVQNYYSDKSITTAAIADAKPPANALTTPSDPLIAMFKKDETATASETYKTTSSTSSQSCGAKYLMWSATGGTDIDKGLNKQYWRGKDNAAGAQVTTGFRVYPSNTSPSYTKSAEAGATKYT